MALAHGRQEARGSLIAFAYCVRAELAMKAFLRLPVPRYLYSTLVLRGYYLNRVIALER